MGQTRWQYLRVRCDDSEAVSSACTDVLELRTRAADAAEPPAVASGNAYAG